MRRMTTRGRRATDRRDPKAASTIGTPTGHKKQVQHRPPSPSPARVDVVRAVLAAHRRTLSHLLTLTLICVALAAATLAPAGKQVVQLGREPEGIGLDGVYGPENSGAFPFRWTRPEGTVRLPIAGPGNYRVTLAMQDGPTTRAPRQAEVLIDGEPVGAASLDPDLRSYAYRVMVEPGAFRRGEPRYLQVTVRTTPYSAPGDPRPLGVVLARVAVELEPSPMWRGIVGGALLASLVTVAFLYRRRDGAGNAGTEGGGVALIAGLALTLAARAAFLAGAHGTPPFAWMAVTVPMVACLAAVVATGMLARRYLARQPGDSYGQSVADFLSGLGLVAIGAASVALPVAGFMPRPVATVTLLLLIAGGAFALVARAVGARGASAGLLAALGLGLAVVSREPFAAARALAEAAREPAVWLALLWAVGGIALLEYLGRAAAEAGAWWAHPVGYLTLDLAFAAWWAWEGQREQPFGLAGLRPLEREALILLPPTILLSGLALCCATLLLPRPDRPRAFRAGLAAALPLVGLPFAAWTLAERPPGAGAAIEERLHIAWLGFFLIAPIALRAAVLLRGLLRSAATGRVGDRRLALGLLALCLLVYWPAGLWRSAAFGLTGDEPQYLAATMSLWRQHNLDLPRSVFSAEMRPLVASPESDLRADVYEDPSGDRLSLTEAAPPRAVHDLPLAGGADLDVRIVVVHERGGLVAVTVTYRDADGREVARATVAAEPGRLTVLPRPDAPDRPLSARVEADAPVVVSVRLRSDSAGLEEYLPAPPANEQCFPMRSAGAGWATMLLVHNVDALPATASWRQYGPDGATVAEGALALTPAGLATVPLTRGVEPSAICATGERPLTALLLGRARPGLVALSAPPAQRGPIAVPEPPRAPSYTVAGGTGLLVHNPADRPVAVTFRRATGQAELVTLAPRATREFLFTVPAGSQRTEFPTGQIEPAGPVLVTALAHLDNHQALLARGAPPGRDLLLPVLDSGRGDYILSQLALANREPAEVATMITTRDTAGAVIDQHQLRLCAACVEHHSFWSAGGGTVSVQADGQLSVTLLQREVRTQWPVHNLGLSLAMLPGYAFAGVRGALATVGLLSALLALTVFGLLRRCGVAAATAVLGAAILALSPPLSAYATQLYAETGGVLLLCLALLFLDRAAAGRWWSLLPALVCAGGAPIFHSRFLPLTLALLATAALVFASRAARRGSLGRRRILALTVGIGILLAVPFAFVLARDPRIRPDYLERYLAPGTLHHHALGVLLDRSTGLLPHLPVLVLAGAGFRLLIGRRPTIGLPALAVVSVHLALVFLRQTGWEAWGPAGRYVLPAVPFLALAAACAWAHEWRFAVRSIAATLALWGLGLAVLYAWIPFGAYYSVAPPYSFGDAVWRHLFGLNPLRLFPSLHAGWPAASGTLLRWTAILGAALLIGFPWPRWRRSV